MKDESCWNEYPRPQMKRKSFFSLNGTWEFCVSKSKDRPESFNDKITVPYPVESELSGINTHFEKGCFLWYRKNFVLPDGFKKDRVILNCGGIDQKCIITVNGITAGEYCTAVEGPVSCDITDFLKSSGSENEIVIRVQDDLDISIPYGKQTEKRGGMWYTPFSGIWQSIWLESVPEKYISEIRITSYIDRAEIEISGTGIQDCTLECKNVFHHMENGKVTVKPENPKPWSPENPHIYDFCIRAGEDEIFSYFALRTFDIRNINGIPRLCLNGKPYFFHGILDQGYFPKGICTPEDPSAYGWDIVAMKKMGFNMLRKHIKIEPEVFYCECDRTGMLVFQDMVNNGRYRYFHDSVLPTIGVIYRNDKMLNRDAKNRDNFVRSMHSTVKRLRNHPCICGWTIFNEGWGQFESGKLYGELKKMDSTRFIDSTSGWFDNGESDVQSRHVYFRKFRMPKADGKPVFLSEFGGYSFKIPEHSFNQSKSYGYRFYKDKEKYMAAVESLYKNEIIPAVKKGLCGDVYTQTADVEDETNGIVTYDRCHIKVSEEKMREIARMLNDELNSCI